MQQGVSRVREALTRKLGPLPVLAWALIAGVGLYLYRARNSAAGPTASTDTNTPNTESTSPQDPVTLQPGESVYDPNTGALVSGTPQSETPVTPPLVPLTPGASFYDPNTGQVVTAPGGSSADVSSNPKTKTSKRTKKTKAQHRESKPVKRTTTGKKKPRSAPRLKGVSRSAGTAIRKSARAVGFSAPRSRGTVRTPHPQTTRTRAKTTSPAAMRQRPAATHHTNPDTQKIAKHPARRKRK